MEKSTKQVNERNQCNPRNRRRPAFDQETKVKAWKSLTLSWRRLSSYRSQSIDLLCKYKSEVMISEMC